MRLDHFFSFAERPFSFYPGLAQKLNISTNSVVLLCLVGWNTEPGSDGWVQLSSTEITKQTGLTDNEQVTARTQLKKINALQESYDRLKHKMFFKIMATEIPYEVCLESGIPETYKVGVGTPENQGSSNTQGDTLKESASVSNFNRMSFIGKWRVRFQKRFGMVYPETKRDHTAAKAILSSTKLSPEELVSLAEKAWSKKGPKFWNCESQSASIPKFCAAYASIIVELNNENSTTNSRSDANAGTLNAGKASQYRGVGRVVPVPDPQRTGS